MNNRDWEIKELDGLTLKEVFIDETGLDDIKVVFGMTDYKNQTIFLNDSLKFDNKIKTLCHELMHCYISEYCCQDEESYTEEEMCDISANSHYIIHEIVERYMEGTQIYEKDGDRIGVI